MTSYSNSNYSRLSLSLMHIKYDRRKHMQHISKNQFLYNTVSKRSLLYFKQSCSLVKHHPSFSEKHTAMLQLMREGYSYTQPHMSIVRFMCPYLNFQPFAILAWRRSRRRKEYTGLQCLMLLSMLQFQVMVIAITPP